MKIKTDFVTNSSSTCFVVMTKEELTLPQFLRLVGVNNDSMFVDVFTKLYQCFKDDLTPLEQSMIDYRCETIEDFVNKRFLSPGTVERIKKAIEKGLNVYVGEMSSENNEIETFFCCDSFVIEDDDVIYDATNDAW